MKNLALNGYGLVEMNQNEMEETNGGGLKDAFFAIIGAIQDIGNGIAEGYSDGRVRRAIAESYSLA